MLLLYIEPEIGSSRFETPLCGETARFAAAELDHERAVEREPPEPDFLGEGSGHCRRIDPTRRRGRPLGTGQRVTPDGGGGPRIKLPVAPRRCRPHPGRDIPRWGRAGDVGRRDAPRSRHASALRDPAHRGDPSAEPQAVIGSIAGYCGLVRRTDVDDRWSYRVAPRVRDRKRRTARGLRRTCNTAVGA